MKVKKIIIITIVSLPTKFTEKFVNNPLFFLSKEETARMSDLARERIFLC